MHAIHSCFVVSRRSILAGKNCLIRQFLTLFIRPRKWSDQTIFKTLSDKKCLIRQFWSLFIRQNTRRKKSYQTFLFLIRCFEVLGSDRDLILRIPSENRTLSADFPCYLVLARESRCDCDFVILVRSGSIPDVLGSLLEMRSVDLSNNYMLSGVIPNAICSCVKVTGMHWTVLPEDRETLTNKKKKGQKLVFAGAWGAIFGQILGCVSDILGDFVMILFLENPNLLQ